MLAPRPARFRGLAGGSQRGDPGTQRAAFRPPLVAVSEPSGTLPRRPSLHLTSWNRKVPILGRGLSESFCSDYENLEQNPIRLKRILPS